MEPFIVGIDITDVDSLFGRDREINTLISCAKRRGNAGIIGARRFGKTCLMKSLESYLSSKPEIGAYPMYFDVKTQCGVKKDPTAVYRTMASILASKMCLDALLPEGVLNINRRCTLDVSCDELDMRIQMEEWNPVYQKQAIFTLAKLLSEKNKYLLLLLDEIDYLLLEAFENPSDFSAIRGAATDRSSNLKFWIAGTSSWSAICTNVGSPELNCGLENVTLSSLSYDDFAILWQYECSLIEDEKLRSTFESLCKDVYKKTGGVPFYAKFIASHMIVNSTNNLPEYDILRDYLCEIVNNRFISDVERSSLYLLAKGPKSFADTIPDGVTGLKTKGLVSLTPDFQYYLPILYLADYLNACGQDRGIIDDNIIELNELEEVVGQIERLRISVNRVYSSSSQVFFSADEDPIEFGILRKPCRDEATMDAFSGSLYKLYYEGSNNGDNLPNKWSMFAKLIRALRHLYNHRLCEPSTMPEEQLLMIVNNGKRPVYEHEFTQMQLTVLKLCRDELYSLTDTRISSEIGPLHDDTVSADNSNNRTLCGRISIDRNRIIGNNHPPYIIDNRNGYAPNNSPQEYDYSEGEEVLFELRQTTNPRTGLPFAFAINVRPSRDN